jgi:LmbE family N-acetylglucosaminyl deacetylase
MENLLAPYESVHSIEATRVLVLAPHPDDEVFGCGGAILSHVTAGTPVRVIIITDGGYGPADAAEREAYVSQRRLECHHAAAVLGYEDLLFWDYADRTAVFGEQLVTKILAAMEAYEADLVYAPSLFEIHPDHRAVAMAAVEAARRIGGAVRLAMYEVGTPLRPNVILDITKFLERKRLAMRCFTSQISLQPYDEQMEALNRYRTYTLPRAVTSAEAFEVVNAANIASGHLAFFSSEYQRQKTLGLPINRYQDLPLVSIIIRSMDRHTLAEALDSIALQTSPNIEVLVVNSRGGQHSDIGQACGRFDLRLINSNGPSLKRSAAANVGLHAAQGLYLMLLDDDDWLLPNHVAKLLDGLLRSHPDSLAIHTAVACINEGGKPTGTIFDRAYDPVSQMVGNRLPIHSVLFSRYLLDVGCIMDKTLDLFEDWDFWLQVGCHTDIPFVPGVSAYYRLHESSGVHNHAAVTSSVYQAIYRKWRSRWPESHLIAAMQKLLKSETLEAMLTERDGQIASLNQAVTERDGQIASFSHQIYALRNSTAWRITFPLRWIAHQIKRVKHLAYVAPTIVKVGGGIWPTLAKTLHIWRSEGRAGIKRIIIDMTTKERNGS